MSAPNYISTEGALRMEAEFEKLMHQERPTVVNNISTAAAEGDLSENAEYIYGKQRLRQIDSRLEWLSQRMDAFKRIEKASTAERVVFLSWVQVEDGEGEERLFRLMGADETDPREGLISYQSPVGRGLLGKRVDDEITVNTPGGVHEYTILGISIEKP